MSSKGVCQLTLSLRQRNVEGSAGDPAPKLDELPTEILEIIFKSIFSARFPEPCTLKQEREQNYCLDRSEATPKKDWRCILTCRRIYAISLPFLYRHADFYRKSRSRGFMDRIRAQPLLGLGVQSFSRSGCLSHEESAEIVKLMPNIETLKAQLRRDNSCTLDLTGLRRLSSFECKWGGSAGPRRDHGMDTQVILPKTVATFIMRRPYEINSLGTLKKTISQLPKLQGLELCLGQFSIDVLNALHVEARLSVLYLRKYRRSATPENLLTDIILTNLSLSSSLVVLSIGGILNGPENVKEISRLLRHLPKTIQSLDISGTALTKAHIPDLLKVCRQLYEIRLGNPMESYNRSWPVPIIYTDELHMTDLEEIILGSSNRKIGPATVHGLDISTMDFAEQDNLKRSRLMSDTSLVLRR